MVAIKKKAVEIQPEDYILAIFKILSIGNKATQEKMYLCGPHHGPQPYL